MNTPQIDIIAVLIAAFLNKLVESVWYSRWLFHPEGGAPKPFSVMPQIWSFVTGLLSAYVLGFFESCLEVTTVSDGMFVGFLIWLGFVATTQIYAYIFRQLPFKQFLIHSGCRLLSLLAMGGILGA